MRIAMRIAIPIGIVLALSLGSVNAQQTGFQFDSSQFPPRSASEVPVPVGLPEVCDEPELLELIADEKVKPLFFGAVTYGDEISTSMPVMVTGEQPPRLFVDRNRDHRFQPDEGFAPAEGSESEWLIDLDAKYLESDSMVIHQPQQVRFRYDRDANRLFISTAGVMTGTVMYQGRPVIARIEDRNGNGRWFDPDDRLFVDLNDDGRIDPLLERIPVQGMRVLQGQLMAIAGDRMGQQIQIQAVDSRGFIQPTMGLLDQSAEITSLEAMVASTSGMQFQINSLDEAIEVPTGEYFVDSVRLTVAGDTGHYYFWFERLRTEPQAVPLGPGQQIELDLLGDLRLTAQTSTTPGLENYQFIITPSLRTTSGLFLRYSRLGTTAAVTENRLRTSSSFQSFNGLGSTGFT